MARIRTLKPEFWGDEKLASMPALTRLVFLGLVSQADDAGRLVDNIKTLDGLLFPETEDTCRTALGELADAERILRYQSESGQRLIQIVNWHKHQKVDHPSKHVLPAPPEGVGPNGEGGEKDSRESREDDAKDSRLDLGPVPVPPTPEQGPGSDTPARPRVDPAKERQWFEGQIETHFWLGTRPPVDAGPAWDMDREWDIFETLAKEHPRNGILHSIGIARVVLGFEETEPLTMRIFNKRGRRDRLNECLAYLRKREMAKGEKSGLLRELLEVVNAA